MNAQNVDDDPDFLAGYAALDRQVHGLDGAPEWPTLRSLLPDLSGCRVIDLGCGFGWYARWAAERGAVSVLGVDLSESMLERARTVNAAPSITYRRADLDRLDLEPSSADLVFSSLALHYVHDLDRLLETVAAALAPGGTFVASVEHPIFSAPTSQEYLDDPSGHRVWPLDRYLVEGRRVRRWFVDDVEKRHRTVATHVNSVIGAGLAVERLVEWGPSPAEIETRPHLGDDLDRPWFLFVRAVRR